MFLIICVHVGEQTAAKIRAAVHAKVSKRWLSMRKSVSEASSSRQELWCYVMKLHTHNNQEREQWYQSAQERKVCRQELLYAGFDY